MTRSKTSKSKTLTLSQLQHAQGGADKKEKYLEIKLVDILVSSYGI